MTAVNRAIKEAKTGAEVICIKRKDVRSVAEHCRMVQFRHLSCDQIAEVFLSGGAKLLGVPVVVQD